MKNSQFEFSDSFSGDSEETNDHYAPPIPVNPSEMGEITCLLEELSTDEAAEALWRHYFPKLVTYASGKMQQMPCKAQDEEDIALSAMFSFFEAVEAGHYDLQSRDDLWRLLVTITFRKISRERRRQYAQKRGGGVTHIGNHAGENGNDPLDSIADSSQMPEFAEDVHQQCKELLDALPDESLRITAQMKLEGCSNDEISDLLHCKSSETRARLKRIRKIWRRHLPE